MGKGRENWCLLPVSEQLHTFKVHNNIPSFLEYYLNHINLYGIYPGSSSCLHCLDFNVFRVLLIPLGQSCFPIIHTSPRAADWQLNSLLIGVMIDRILNSLRFPYWSCFFFLPSISLFSGHLTSLRASIYYLQANSAFINCPYSQTSTEFTTWITLLHSKLWTHNNLLMNLNTFWTKITSESTKCFK